MGLCPPFPLEGVEGAGFVLVLVYYLVPTCIGQCHIMRLQSADYRAPSTSAFAALAGAELMSGTSNRSQKLLPAAMLRHIRCDYKIIISGSAQRLLVDLELLGDIGLGDAESRGVLCSAVGTYSALPVVRLRFGDAEVGKSWERGFTVKLRFCLIAMSNAVLSAYRVSLSAISLDHRYYRLSTICRFTYLSLS